MPQQPVKLLKNEQIMLLYYLETGNVSFKWIPRLNIVHQILPDLQISTLFSPIWWCNNVFYWFSLSVISIIPCSATAAADLFAQNSSAPTFNVLLSWVLLLIVFESQWRSIGYSSWIGLSIMPFLVRILTDLIVLSVPMKIFSIIPIFHFPRFFSSLSIITISLILITGFSLGLSLCLSLRAAKYSWNHFFQAASLHFCTYLCCFFHLWLTSSSSGESSGNLISFQES